MTYTVLLTDEALGDLQRIERFLIEQALRHDDLDSPARAVQAISREMRILKTNPYTCRKVAAALWSGSWSSLSVPPDSWHCSRF